MDSAKREHDNNNILASFDILAEAREISNKNGFTEEYVACLNMLTRLYAYIDDFEEAIQLNREAYEISEACRDSVSIMRALNNRGVIAGMKGNQVESGKIFRRLHVLSVGLDDSVMSLTAMRNLAAIELNLGNYAKSLCLIDTILRDFHPSVNDDVYWELRNLEASVYQETDNLDKAVAIYDTIMRLAPESSILRPEIARKRALMEARAGDRLTALELLEKARVSSDPISRYFLYNQ